MKRLKYYLGAFILILILVVYTQYPKLTIISGYAAKNMASVVMVAGRSAESVTTQDNNVPLVKLASAEVNQAAGDAEASVFGLMQRRAVFRPGLGAVLVTDEADGSSFSLRPQRQIRKDSLPFPFGNSGIRDTLFAEVDYGLLEAALDSAFSRPGEQRTRTVLIAYKNELLAERYAAGFTPETPVLGWSMTKSVLATWIGIMAYQGLLDIEAPAAVASWQADSRAGITLNHLLRMQSGLEWDEDYSGISDVTRMLFLEEDMPKLQEEKEALAAPGKIWNYSSGTTNLLSGILRNYFDTHQDYLDYPYSALIDRIGMNTMLLEADMAGNYVGSSYAWASTRDWAKFGLLFLNRGNWNGDQVFDPDFVDYVCLPTENSEGTYGAHFWLNANGKYPNLPRDLFSANGHLGQRVFIIPSKELVVVRTGLAEDPAFDTNSFLENILAALP